MVDLSDLVLDGYRCQLERCSTGPRKEAVLKIYEKDRKALIMPLVKRSFYEEAASLAEKYLEFTSLIQICEATSDKSRLDRYMDTFAEYNFSAFVFQWHVSEGKQGKLLAEVSGSRRVDLGRFLEGQGHSGISWLHDLNVGKYGKAAGTLKGLAEDENDLVARKKVADFSYNLNFQVTLEAIPYSLDNAELGQALDPGLG